MVCVAKMADEDEAMEEALEPGEVEDVEEEEDIEAILAAMPEVSLDIFDVVKTSRAQHGLRHGDYLRYRQYCARKLHRLRKSLKLTQGKGRFVKRPLEPRMVAEGKHLLIPLFACERAWSYAMQLKRESSQDSMRPRYHLLSRLAKAAKSAEMLSALCATRGDKRTGLEAEAYAAFMVGNLNLEREQWGAALTQLKRTRTICTELGRASLAEHAHLYLQTVEEVEPSIRFCAYNLRREGGEAEGEGDDTLDDLAEAEGASDILRSKLEAVLQESRARQALDFSEIEVLGERLPIKNEKARVGLLAMHGQLQEIAQLSKAGGDPSTLYDQLFVYFNDALDAARADLRAASKDSSAKAGVASEQLRKLVAHLMWQKLTYTTQQRLLLIAKQKGKDGGGSGRKGWAEDLVRLYETVQSNHEEMRALEGYKDSAPHMALLGAQSASVATFRCFYVGEAYAAAAQWREAQALYNRALERLTDALGRFEAVGGGAGGAEGVAASKEGTAALRKLEQQIEGAKARAHAQAFTNALGGGPAVIEAQQAVEGVALDAPRDLGVPELLDSLHTFTREQPDHVISFPPRFEVVPCKPLLFDVARNAIRYPDLRKDARVELASTARGYLGGATAGAASLAGKSVSKLSGWFSRS